MPQRNVASNFTFEQQRVEINNLAQDFWTHKTGSDNAAPTYLKHDGSNAFTGQTLNVPNAFTINSNSGNGTVTISGNLDVTGTTTTVSSANLEVTDKNILISKGSTTDAQADGAGITIDSATDITFNFVDAKDALVSSIGLEGTTFLKAPYGQFTGSGTPGGGQGVEINAPDTNTGQIASYDRANTAYKQLNIKGSSVQLYAGTSNAIVGTFNSTGLAVAAASAAVTIQATNPSNTSTSTLKFKNLDGNSNYRDVVTIDGESTGNGGYGAFVVKTAFNNSLIERLRIDQNGNTNFGAEKAVAFPSGTGIQVYHSANPRIKLTNDTTGNGATDGTQIYLSSDGDTIIDNKDSEDIIIHSNASEKFKVSSTGSKTTGYHQQTAPIGFCAYRLDTGTDNEYPMSNSSNGSINDGYFGQSSLQTPRGQLTTHTEYNNNGSGGSCYNHDGTKFTAPIAGVYTLTFNLSLYVVNDTGGDNSVGWGFLKNQTKLNWNTYDSGLSISQSTPYVIGANSGDTLTNAFEIGAPHLTIITTLAANDEIQVGWDNMSKILGVRSFIFSGHLLG